MAAKVDNMDDIKGAVKENRTKKQWSPTPDGVGKATGWLCVATAERLTGQRSREASLHTPGATTSAC